MGRSEEFTRLLSEHRDALYRFSRQNCWDRARAEDALQEAVMSAFRGFDRFVPGTNFKAWIFRFLINTLLNENRRFRKEPHTVDAAEAGDAAPAVRVTHAYDLLEAAEREDFLQQLSDPLKKALESLSPAERMVFLLRTVEEFSYKEISDLLDIPGGTAMSHLHRGRAKLRERLADYGREHGWKDGPAESGADGTGPPGASKKGGPPPKM